MNKYSKEKYLKHKEKRYDICKCGNKKLKNSVLCRTCSLKSKKRGDKISKSLKGHKIYKSKERNNNISKALKGKTSAFKGHKHSEESKEKNRLAHTKEDSLAPLIKKVRWCSRYKKWKDDILNRDNNRCSKCGEEHPVLEIHHKTEICKILKKYEIKTIEDAHICDELWDTNNGITLCVPCHVSEDKYRKMPNRDLILGAGEIGISLYNILKKEYNVLVADKDTDISKIGQVRYLHICFPYSDKFIEQVKEYKKIFRPLRVICHSTVPVGTNEKLGTVSSPVVGIHPHLTESLKIFTKFLGGKDASNVAQYFRRAGIKVYLFPKSETCELAKIASTTFYAVMIEYVKELNRECIKNNLSFTEVYTLWTDNYNKGYSKLGYPEYCRPNLVPIMTPQNGHCTIPNLEFWENDFTNLIKRLNKK